MAVGCAVVALAAGQAWADTCAPEDKALAPGASAPAAEPAADPAGETGEEAAAEAGTTDGPASAGPSSAGTASAGPASAGPGGAAGAAAAADPASAVQPSDSDLVAIGIDPDAATPGGTTTVHAFVGNLGPDATASPFTVVVTLPEGVTAEGPYVPDNCYAFQEGHRVRCTFPAGLAPYRSATALIPVRLAATVPAPGTLTGGWVAVRSPDDCNEENNKQPFEIPVVEPTGPRPAV
ncbi:hypothetical protein [Kitasatospora sp. NPDC015120]|uniref:hypothetical protein n=1 Tax=Kitasatospora sp. NPDC015120 TaxID=3364023 RepID=UPI0036F45300